MKRFLLTVLLIFITIIIGGYFFIGNDKQSEESASGKSSKEIDKIKIANIGEYSVLNLIAKEKKYFEDNNLEAQIIEYSSGPSAVSDLLTGKVDFAVAADFVGVRNMLTNEELMILAELSKHEDFYVVAKKDSGIYSPHDLKEKRIGVTKQGVGEFFLGRFLTLNNLDLKDVDVVDLPPAEIVNKLKNGDISAAVVFNPHVYALQKDLGDKIIAWSAQSGQKVFALLYTTNSFIANNPDAAHRYLRSLLRAEQFLKNNNDEAKGILAKYMNYETAYVDQIWPKFDFTIRLEQTLLLSMEDQTRFIIKNNMTNTKDTPNYLNRIHFNALQTNAPERISIIR